MRKLITLEYYSKNIYTRYYYTRRMKSQLDESTPTLLIASYDRNNREHRRFNTSNMNSLYCRACDNIILAPYVSYNLEKNRGIYCPTCGHYHKDISCRIVNNANSHIPINIVVSLYEKKKSVEVIIKYGAVVMGDNPFTDLKEVDVREIFLFDTENNEVLWKKEVNGKHRDYISIGYISDIDTMDEESALSFIRPRFCDKNKKTMAVFYRELRNVIDRKMRERGYSKRNLYLANGDKYKVLDSMLKIAHWVRFWDGEDIAIYGKRTKSINEWLKKWGVSRDFEMSLNARIKQGENYIEAVLHTFSLPDVKLVRQNIKYENFDLLKSLYKEIPNVLIANNFINPLLEYRNNGGNYREILEFYNIFNSIYKISAEQIVSIFKNKYGADILGLWKNMDSVSKKNFYNNIPSLSKLHDTLAIAVAQQKDREIEYDIPKEILERMNMYIQNSKIEVLQKYSQLKKASLDLHNCASRYRNMINENLQLVLVSDDNGKPIILLEINGNEIVQAKLMSNKSVKNINTYNELVLAFAEKARLKVATKDVDIIKEIKTA